MSKLFCKLGGVLEEAEALLTDLRARPYDTELLKASPLKGGRKVSLKKNMAVILCRLFPLSNQQVVRKGVMRPCQGQARLLHPLASLDTHGKKLTASTRMTVPPFS